MCVLIAVIGVQIETRVADTLREVFLCSLTRGVHRGKEPCAKKLWVKESAVYR